MPLEHFVLQLDEVLIASANEKHLGAFKELPDFASFKGRIELVRVPYLRRYKLEQEIYDAQITPHVGGQARGAARHRGGRHVGGAHAAEEAHPGSLRRGREGAGRSRSPRWRRCTSTQEARAPDRLSLANTKELKKLRTELYEESDAYPNYEGRWAPRRARSRRRSSTRRRTPTTSACTPLAVFEELEALCQDKSVYEFLQQEVVDGYHDHEEFVRVVEGEYLDRVDSEVRDSMGLVSEGQYRELVERYVQNVSHWVRGEKMRNRVTGEMERPDEQRMAELEAIVMPKGEDAGEFRRGLISSIGAHRLDNPDAAMDYSRIFPDMFKRLRDHYFEERKRVLRKNKENVLKYLSEERAALRHGADAGGEHAQDDGGEVRVLRALREGRHPVPDEEALRLRAGGQGRAGRPPCFSITARAREDLPHQALYASAVPRHPGALMNRFLLGAPALFALLSCASAAPSSPPAAVVPRLRASRRRWSRR